jgi:hypothetical protein
LVSSAQAALVITFTESAGNVSYLASGGLNLAGMTSDSTTYTTETTSGIHPLAGGFVNQMAVGLTQLAYIGVIGPVSFGSGGEALASTSTGTAVFFSPNENVLFVSSTYVSESPLPMSGSYAGKTLANLGLTPGIYTWNLGTGPSADTLSIRVVPEPTVPLMGALGALTALRRRRR